MKKEKAPKRIKPIDGEVTAKDQRPKTPPKK
jgi:hypothetical protein